MARVLIPLALLLIAFWVFSIVDCALQPPSRHRGVSKPVWLLIVVVLPVIGGALWFIVGRSTPAAAAPGPRAPDDDPEFLGRIGTVSDQDERIRRLEAELAALDAEADDPPHPDDPPVPRPHDGSRDAREDGDDQSGARG